MSPRIHLLSAAYHNKTLIIQIAGNLNVWRSIVVMAENTKKCMSKITFSSKTKDVNSGKKTSSHEPYFVLEIPQEILMHWHDLKAKDRGAYTYANFIANEQVLPFRIVGNAASEKRVNDAACIALRECRGKS